MYVQHVAAEISCISFETVVEIVLLTCSYVVLEMDEICFSMLFANNGFAACFR